MLLKKKTLPAKPLGYRRKEHLQEMVLDGLLEGYPIWQEYPYTGLNEYIDCSRLFTALHFDGKKGEPQCMNSKLEPLHNMVYDENFVIQTGVILYVFPPVTSF